MLSICPSPLLGLDTFATSLFFYTKNLVWLVFAFRLISANRAGISPPVC